MADDDEVKPQYTVANPHPGFGKDPNIANEFGHIVYPKYVKNADGQLVIVQNEDEENEVKITSPDASEDTPKAKSPKGWPK